MLARSPLLLASAFLFLGSLALRGPSVNAATFANDCCYKRAYCCTKNRNCCPKRLSAGPESMAVPDSDAAEY